MAVTAFQSAFRLIIFSNMLSFEIVIPNLFVSTYLLHLNLQPNARFTHYLITEDKSHSFEEFYRKICMVSRKKFMSDDLGSALRCNKDDCFAAFGWNFQKWRIYYYDKLGSTKNVRGVWNVVEQVKKEVKERHRLIISELMNFSPYCIISAELWSLTGEIE